jgi:fluoroacetyl-CoA thioesterase
MKATLQAGIESEFSFLVPSTKTVPALYPESNEFRQMPDVFATGFMVGLIEWACIRAINAHLDWPSEQTVGTHVDVSHEAATPPGLEVTVRVKLVRVDGRKLCFDVEAHDGIHRISKGTHERFVIERARFDASVARKGAAQAAGR